MQQDKHDCLLGSPSCPSRKRLPQLTGAEPVTDLTENIRKFENEDELTGIQAFKVGNRSLRS